MEKKILSFIISVLIVVFQTKNVNCLNCELSVQGQNPVSIDCNSKAYGEFQNICVTSIIKNGSNVIAASSCLAKAANAAACGQTATVNSVTTTICCCQTDNCNDADFVNKCRDNKAPTSKPPGFQCIMKAGIGSTAVSGQMECKNPIFGDNFDKCAVFVNQTEAKTLLNHMCLPKSAGLFACGNTTMIEGSKMKVCCCDGPKCNDDAFAKKCAYGTSPAVNIAIGAVVFVFSMFLSLTTIALA